MKKGVQTPISLSRKSLFPYAGTLSIMMGLLLFLGSGGLFAGNDNLGLIMNGVGKTVVAAAQVPQALSRSGGAFPFGIVNAAMGGSMRALQGALNGASDIARGAAPYAKYMLFFI